MRVWVEFFGPTLKFRTVSQVRTVGTSSSFMTIFRSRSIWTSIRLIGPCIGPTAETRRVPAGQLLDACDCRGLRVGGALVFPKHANIIVNAGRATARDVLQLAAIMKARVQARFGVTLEEEVMFLGERPELERAEG